MYEVFYLSIIGSDMAACGKTESTACKTLEHVISLYYNTTGQPQKGLEIITSKSLTVGKALKVRFFICRHKLV